MTDTDITFKITAQLGVIADSSTGWQRELNLVSWNGNEPKFDIREWSPDHLRMSRGITLTPTEMATTIKLYQEYERINSVLNR